MHPNIERTFVCLSVRLSGTDFSETTGPNLMKLCMRYLHSLTMSKKRKKFSISRKKNFDFSISRIFPIFVEFIILADEVKNSQNEIFLIFLIFRFHYFFQFLSNSSFWPLRRKFRQKIAKMKFPNNKKRLSVSLSGTDFSKTTWPNLMTLCMRYLHSLTMSNTRKKIFYFAKKIFRFHEFFPEFFRTYLFGRLDRFRQTQWLHTKKSRKLRRGLRR